jgi:radical SAM superfamily enzyme YgiQ (UPF0313 family)
MEYLKEYYPPTDESPFSLFKKFQHFGLSFLEIEGILKEKKAEVVGISALFTPYQKEALEVVKIVKETLPNALTVLGGGFPTCEPERALLNPTVDFIVIGEGEEPLCNLLVRLEKGSKDFNIPGLGYKNGTELHIRPSAVSGVFPARVIKFLPQNVQLRKKKQVSIQTSRGCPYQCKFCSSKLLFPGEFRQREAMDVVAEMLSIHRVISVDEFNFEDDNLTYNKEWTLKFCSEIIRYFGKRKLKLSAMNGLCAADLDDDLLAAMYEAGFEKLDLSLAFLAKRK